MYASRTPGWDRVKPGAVRLAAAEGVGGAAQAAIGQAKPSSTSARAAEAPLTRIPAFVMAYHRSQAPTTQAPALSREPERGHKGPVWLAWSGRSGRNLPRLHRLGPEGPKRAAGDKMP